MTWQNDDVGSGRYFFKGGVSHTLDIGGLLTSDDAQNVDTGGNFINIKTTKPWSYEADNLVCDETNPNRLEQETAQALSNSFKPTTFTFTCVDQTIWTGVGAVVGDIKQDRSKSTMPIKVMGSGVLVQI